MDDEKLISLVENNDVIYNKFNKDYRIPDKKRAVWTGICKEMGVPVELCMKRWSSLRDRYAKEKKNEKLASGSGASFKHRWQYINQLEFLAPHVVARPVRSTINIAEQITPRYEYSQEVNSSFSEIQFEDTQFLECEPQEPSLQSPVVTPLQQKQKKGKKRNESFEESDQIFADAVETFKKFCKSKEDKERRKGTDTVHAFGKMVCATLNSLSEKKKQGYKINNRCAYAVKIGA